MESIKMFVFCCLFLTVSLSLLQCDHPGDKSKDGESDAGMILFQATKDLEPDMVLDNGTKVISRSGNNLLGMDIHGHIFVTRKDDLQQMFFLGNGKDLGPDFEKGGIILQTNNQYDSIYNSLTLNNGAIGIQRNNMDNSVIAGMHVFTKNAPTEKPVLSYTQWGLGLNNEHDPNKIVMQHWSENSGQMAFHVRAGSKVTWFQMPVYNSLEEAESDGLGVWDTFAAGPDFNDPRVFPGQHITILPE